MGASLLAKIQSEVAQGRLLWVQRQQRLAIEKGGAFAADLDEEHRRADAWAAAVELAKQDSVVLKRLRQIPLVIAHATGEDAWLEFAFEPVDLSEPEQERSEHARVQAAAFIEVVQGHGLATYVPVPEPEPFDDGRLTSYKVRVGPRFYLRDGVQPITNRILSVKDLLRD